MTERRRTAGALSRKIALAVEVFAASNSTSRAGAALKALYAYDPQTARAEAAPPRNAGPRAPPQDRSTACGDRKGEIASLAFRCHSAPRDEAHSRRAGRARPARLREAGAIMFSKTTDADYGMTSSGVSSFHPLTRNPWD